MKHTFYFKKNEDMMDINGSTFDGDIFIELSNDSKINSYLVNTREFGFVDNLIEKLLASDNLEGDFLSLNGDLESIKSFISYVLCFYTGTAKISQSSIKNKISIETLD